MTEERRTAAGLADYLADRRTDLPKAYSSEEAAERVVALFQNSGGLGATFNLYFGDLSGQPLFAVSPYPEFSDTTPGVEIDQRDLKAFIRKNQALLDDPRNSIGLWYDERQGEVWMDVSTVLPGKEEAREIGERYNQIDGFDLQKNEAFPCGGSGEPVEDMPPPTERLPKLLRE